MKKLLIVLMISLFPLVWLLSATITADSPDEIEEKMEAFGEKVEAFGERVGEKAEMLGENIEFAIDGDDETRIITVNSTTESAGERAYMGVYYENLTLNKVRELDYPYNYGVLITGTGASSPAHQHGLAADDVLIEIDGKKCIDKDKFVKIIQSYMPDQTVPIKYFSYGEEKVMNFTFGRRPEKKVTTTTTKSVITSEKRLDYPSLEFMYTPYWYMMDDIEDVNDVIGKMGFDKLDEDGVFYNGFTGRIHVGKGFYLGAMGTSYKINRKVGHLISTSDSSNPIQPDEYKDSTKDFSVTRRMEFKSNWWGITIDKKFMLAKWIQPTLGIALGSGNQTLNFTQTNGVYNWNDLDNQFDSDSNNAMKMKRSYYIARPKADLYIGILSWLGIRAEGSYLIGYSSEPGWKETSGNFIIDNSPETTMNGYAFTVGPWISFGF